VRHAACSDGRVLEVSGGLEAGRFAPEDAYALPLLDRLMNMRRARARALVALAFGSTLVIDGVTPIETSFAFLYVVPIAMATWSLDRRAGTRVAIAAPFAAYAMDWLNVLPGRVPMWVHWTFVVHFAFFMSFAWAMALVRATYVRTKIDTMRDVATGLANRRAFYDAVAVEVNRAQRFRRSISLAYVIVDEEHARDLAATGALVKALSATRKYDVPARIGEAEYVLLMPETGAEAARVAMGRVKSALAPAARARIGIATSEWAPTCVDELLREADRAMAALEDRPPGEILHVVNGGTITPARVSR
jgi:diguanylate cyclase (GGDEF)-like protein